MFATKICRIAWITFAISNRPTAHLHGGFNKIIETLSAFALLKFFREFDFWLKMENSNGYFT